MAVHVQRAGWRTKRSALPRECYAIPHERLAMSLKNKVAIVTGGNSGIGLAIVLELARQEASIVIDYVVHPEATETLERQVSRLGSQSIGIAADVSKCADLEKLVEA